VRILITCAGWGEESRATWPGIWSLGRVLYAASEGKWKIDKVTRNMKDKQDSKQDDSGVTIKTAVTPLDGLMAVFEDGSSYEEFPVIMFVVFRDEDEGTDEMVGLISSPDGLTPADHDESFVGYRVADQEIAEFLEDHGRDPLTEEEA
jgi:hypothetical protein